MKEQISNNEGQAINVMRLIRELFDNSLKCDRVGHKIKTYEHTIRKSGAGFGVCTDFKAKFDRCTRCKSHYPQPYNLKEITTYNSVSMPTSMWNAIRQDGYVIVD